MFLKISAALVVVFVHTGIILSQQLPFSNQYLVNRHFLSPAYSGLSDNFEAFLSYKKDFLGFDGAPEFKSIYASGPVYENMSLGVSVSKSSVTIFNVFSTKLDYAYHLRVSGEQYLHFGLSVEYMENYVGMENQTISAQTDPYLMENGHAFDAGFGLIYTYKTFQLGVAVPRMLESKIRNSDGGNTVYTVSNIYRLHASYLFNVNRSFSIEPLAVIDKSDLQPLWYNVSTIFKYREATWVEVHYRQGGIMGICLGVNPSKKLLLNYSYEFSGTGMMKYSSGSHEITLGFLLGKNNESKYRKSAFRSLSKQPYYDWIK